MQEGFIDGETGDKVTMFGTPDGFEVVLVKPRAGAVKTKLYFEHKLVDIDLAMSRMTDESKRILAAKSAEFFA